LTPGTGGSIIGRTWYYYAVFFNAESAENAENGCQRGQKEKETAFSLGAWNSARPGPGRDAGVVKQEVISALSAFSALR